MVNGIDSLIAFSDFSLLVYRNISDICVLIVYPATLLNSLISFSDIVLRVFYVQYHVICKKSESFASFLIWIPFISFLYSDWSS